MSSPAQKRPPEWMDIWPGVNRKRRQEQRLAVVDCDWVSGFLRGRGIEHERASTDTCRSEGVVFLPASSVATTASAQEVVDRFAGKAKVVLCGAPTSLSWLGAPGLVPGTVFAALGRDPNSDRLGWVGTCEKIYSGQVFSMRPYLEPDATYRYFSLSSGAHRHSVLESIAAELERADLSGRALASVVDALEELMIRSLSAAATAMGLSPADLDGVSLPQRCEIRLTVGFDNNTIGVGACDLFSHAVTDPATIVDALRTVLSAQRIDGSQDIALIKAAQAANHFVVNLAGAGVCEVICFVARGAAHGSRGRALANRSFGVFLR